MKKNRWLIALSAMGIHICIGSVYAWSVLTRPIMQAMGFSLKDTTWTFSLAILFLGLSAGFLGSFVQKIGPITYWMPDHNTKPRKPISTNTFKISL